MQRRHIATLAAVFLVASAGTAIAAENPQSMQDMMRQHHPEAAQGQQAMMMNCPMMQGMMGGGTMGRGMMGGGTMQGPMGARMPQLPPGNEKLQLQMQAEIMQKVGEIMARYAAQLR